MSDDNSELPAWRRKFLATRMAVESILFERELLQPKKEKLSTGLLVLGAIWLFYTGLLAQWALRRGTFFNSADAESFGQVLRYAAYFKSQGFWALVRPELSDLTLNPPLYYLTYLPVMKFITADLNLALILVNSFFLLLIGLAIFIAVKESRPNPAGWFGAAFALALPFVMETARRPAPEMALMAFAAAAYAFYIRSDEFMDTRWTFAFAVALGLGFYSHRAFWLYALPLAPFIMSGLANPSARDEMFKVMLVAVVINLPWYVFSGAVVAAGLVPLWGDYHGFLHYFRLGVSAAGLPMFLLGAAALAWLYFSVFMAYRDKKVVAAWFWVPYIVLAWGLRGTRPELFYPAMLPFAIAVAIMTPYQARKFLLIAVMALAAVNQGGILRPVPSGSRYPVAGLPLPPSADYRADKLMALVRANTPAGGGLVAVYGDDNLNADSLRFAFTGEASSVRFSDSPACPACAFAVIRKTVPVGKPETAAEKEFSSFRNGEWFAAVFDKKAELALADHSKAEFYVKTPSSLKFFEEGRHKVRGLRLGALEIEECTLTLSGFDERTGAYARASLFAPVAQLAGGDIYGLNADITGLASAGPSLSPFVPSSVGGVTLRSARVSSYAVERWLAARFPFLKDIEVKLEDGLEISGTARGRRLEAGFALSLSGDGVLEARPNYFSLGPVNVSPYLLKLFSFRVNLADNPYNIKVAGLRVGGQMIEFY